MPPTSRVRHQPDPDHPGWWTWEVADKSRFNAVLGKMLVRAEGIGHATCRMFPEARHLNMHDRLHGGLILTFIDMALFAGGKLSGADVVGAVTLNLDTQFLGQGRIGIPMDAEVELLRETGRLAFLRGRVVQDGQVLAAFTGMLRKASKVPPHRDDGEGTHPKGGGGVSDSPDEGAMK